MGYIYTLPKSVQVNFLWGKNDVKTVIEHEYYSFIPPQNEFLATPGIGADFLRELLLLFILF